jgi:hypothetical protein
VRAQRGLGCIATNMPKIAKKMSRVIILTRFETFLIIKRIIAVVVTMRYRRYLGEQIS